MSSSGAGVPSAEDRRGVYEQLRTDIDALLKPELGASSSDGAQPPKHQSGDKASAVPPGEMAYVTHLANISSLIFYQLNALCDKAAPLQQLPVNWVGFYLLTSPQTLTLGPFQGKVACTQIKLGKGVCGVAALHGKPIAVPDVHKYPGHIACDSESHSEVVVPIRSPQNNNRLVGLLDIDSTVSGFFSEADVAPLQAICDAIGDRITFPIAMQVTKPLGAADTPQQPQQSQHGHEHPAKAGMRRGTSGNGGGSGSGISFFTYTGKDLIQDPRPSASVKVVHGWSLNVTRLDRIMPSDSYAALEERLSIHALPEILFEHNGFVFSHKHSGVSVSVTLEHLLRSCKDYYASREYQKYISGEAVDPLEIPSAKKWRGRRASHTLFQPGIDWAMRNAFCGAWSKGDAAIDLEKHRCAPSGGNVKKIDYERLKDQSREILFYDSFDMFEDELHDCGTTQFSAKFRVMDDCYFVLLRHFIRVDGVAAVARDTRIYHEFVADAPPPSAAAGEGERKSGVVVIECTERDLKLEPIDVNDRDGGPARKMHATRNVDEIYPSMKIKSEALFNLWL